MPSKSTVPGDSEWFPLNGNSIVFYPQTETFAVKVLLMRFCLNSQLQQRIKSTESEVTMQKFCLPLKVRGRNGLNQTLRENN